MSSEGLIRREYACMFRQSCGKRTCLEGWEGGLILELVACLIRLRRLGLWTLLELDSRKLSYQLEL